MGLDTERRSRLKTEQFFANRIDAIQVILACGALFVALVVHILIPWLAWRWSQRPFLGVLLEHTLVVGAVESRWEGARAGLNHPDRILAIHGSPVRHCQELDPILASLSLGEPVSLTVETQGRDAAWVTRQAEIELGSLPAADWLIQFFIPYLVALCYLAIGALVFFLGRRRRQARAFALFCAGASILMAAYFDMHTTHVLTRVWIAAFPLTGLALVYLGSTLLREKTPVQWIKWVRLALVIVASVIFVWNQISLYSADPRGYFIPWLSNYLLVAASFTIFVATLIYIRIRPYYVRLRLQAQMILVGVLFSFMPTMLWVATSTLGRIFPKVGQIFPFQPLIHFVPMAVFPLAAGYAIHRYRFMDVELLLNPYYPTQRDVRAELQNFSRELTASLDLKLILNKLLSHIGRMFHPQHALVFTLAQDGSYGLDAAWGQVNRAPLQAVRFTSQDQTILKLRREGESLRWPENDAWAQRLDAEERARLGNLNVVLLVPLRAKEHLLGVLALGPLVSRDQYAHDDMALLSTMADQAAVAIENARLYAQQVEQGRYLVQQTRRLTDILALGNQLKSLDYDVVVQSTAEAVCQSLGFGLVTLSLIDEDDPQRVRVAAWAGVRSATWEWLASTSFPLVDFEAITGAQKLGHCYFVYSPGSEAAISTPQRVIPWEEGDQLYVPLTSNEGLLGYLTVDRPESGLRPTEDTLEVLEIFANQAAIAIQNANLYAGIDQALDERLAELSTLQEIDRQINAKLDFQHVMDTTLEWAMRITSAVAGTLALVSEDRQTLQVVAHRGYPEEISRYLDDLWPVSEGIIGRVARTGKPELVEDILQDADYVDTMSSVRSHLSAPLKREEQVIGVISLESSEPNGFSAAHLAFLTRLADHATIAIENASLYDQTQRRVAELSALQQISLELTSSLELRAVLESIAENARQLVSADQVTLYLYDDHQDALSFGASLSERGQEAKPPIPIAENQITRTVARQGEAIVIHDAREHPEIPLGNWQIGAIASFPLRVDRVLGVFDVSFTRAHPFTPDELRVLNLLANQAAIALKNAQLYADVQRANEAKSEFVSIVSHELKVPMTSIQGYARLITLGAAGEVTEKQREFVGVILSNVARMSNLVSELLDSSRIESGRIKLSPRPISLSRIINDSINTVRAEIRARNHQLTVDVPDDLPKVQADPGWITQVVSNLLSNAYKYTPAGGQIKVRAQLRTGLESENGAWVMCAVEDSGVGLLPEDQERIFEQFYRVRDPQTAHEAGTGLGLPITRSIVELHGGHIWVESTYGKGSTFYFTLPVAEDA
jgi:signal transduction histidine kinase